MRDSTRRGYNGHVLRTEALTGHNSIVELRDRWRDLLLESPTATPFQTWEWQSTWWRHFGGLKKQHIVSVFEGDDLVGIMPLAITTGIWRTLRASGTGVSDYLHPIARAGYESAVSEAVSAHLAEARCIDLIDLHQVREDQPLGAMQCDHAIDQAKTLVLNLPKSYEGYLGTLSKSLRYDVRRIDKELSSKYDATIEEVATEDTHEGMEWLFETHKKRWRKRGMPGAFLRKTSAFHHDWASQAAQNGWLRLRLLKVKGQPVGALYAMSLHDTCYYYQAGFDPAHKAFSPGSLLVAATIRGAVEEGCQKFDFLRGDEPYKRRWKPQSVLTNLRLLRVASPIAGRLGLRWNGFGGRLENKLRARLEGKGLL